MNGRFKLIALYPTTPELPHILDGSILECVDAENLGYLVEFPSVCLESDDRIAEFMQACGHNMPPQDELPVVEYEISIKLIPPEIPYVSPYRKFTDDEVADIKRQIRENGGPRHDRK